MPKSAKARRLRTTIANSRSTWQGSSPLGRQRTDCSRHEKCQRQKRVRDRDRPAKKLSFETYRPQSCNKRWKPAQNVAALRRKLAALRCNELTYNLSARSAKQLIYKTIARAGRDG